LLPKIVPKNPKCLKLNFHFKNRSFSTNLPIKTTSIHLIPLVKGPLAILVLRKRKRNIKTAMWLNRRNFKLRLKWRRNAQSSKKCSLVRDRYNNWRKDSWRKREKEITKWDCIQNQHESSMRFEGLQIWLIEKNKKSLKEASGPGKTLIRGILLKSLLQVRRFATKVIQKTQPINF